jgi:hypothetical protein
LNRQTTNDSMSRLRRKVPGLDFEFQVPGLRSTGYAATLLSRRQNRRRIDRVI